MPSPKISYKNSNGWPVKFSCKFIEPGLVRYQDHGTVLVRKEALDKMAKSFIGRPVINEVHKDVSPHTFEEDADGIVTNVYYNSDGWYWADFLVWDDATKKNCGSNAYSVSCAYDVNEFKREQGEHNNIPYEQEVLSGEYTHLAIVANPRYEDARIIINNSKGGSPMIIKLWNKAKEIIKNAASETDLEKVMVNTKGGKVPLKNLIDAYKADREEKLRLANAEGNEPLAEDTVIEIDGEETTVKNLIDLNEARNAKLKNEEDEEKKKKDEEEKAAENARKNAEDEEKKKKEDEEKKKAENDLKCENCGHMRNSKDEACKPCADKKALENDKHFDKLKNADKLRGAPVEIKVATQRDRLAVGKQKYGAR